MLSWDTPDGVYKLLIYFDLQHIQHFIMLPYFSSQNYAYIKHFKSICLWYFVTQLFTAVEYIYDFLKTLISNKEQHWKTGIYQGSENICEGDRYSDLNCMGSAILDNTLM